MGRSFPRVDPAVELAVGLLQRVLPPLRLGHGPAHDALAGPVIQPVPVPLRRRSHQRHARGRGIKAPDRVHHQIELHASPRHRQRPVRKPLHHHPRQVVPVERFPVRIHPRRHIRRTLKPDQPLPLPRRHRQLDHHRMLHILSLAKRGIPRRGTATLPVRAKPRHPRQPILARVLQNRLERSAQRPAVRGQGLWFCLLIHTGKGARFLGNRTAGLGSRAGGAAGMCGRGRILHDRLHP